MRVVPRPPNSSRALTVTALGAALISSAARLLAQTSESLRTRIGEDIPIFQMTCDLSDSRTSIETCKKAIKEYWRFIDNDLALRNGSANPIDRHNHEIDRTKLEREVNQGYAIIRALRRRHEVIQ